MFPTLPVEANLLLGASGRSFGPNRHVDLRYARRRGEVRDARPSTAAAQARRAPRAAGGPHLGGEQQMVAIGRALMAEPRALAIDELSLGLAPIIVEQLAEFLLHAEREGRRCDPARRADAALAFTSASARTSSRRAACALAGASRRSAAGPDEQRVPRRRPGVTTFLQLVVVGLSTGSAFGLVGIGSCSSTAHRDRQLRTGRVRRDRRAATYSPSTTFARSGGARATLVTRSRRASSPSSPSASADGRPRSRASSSRSAVVPRRGPAPARVRRRPAHVLRGSRITPGTSTACLVQPQYVALPASRSPRPPASPSSSVARSSGRRSSRRRTRAAPPSSIGFNVAPSR